MLKPFLLLAGFISLILGVIGAALPILPTTPFLILSAFLFSKSSPRFHRWILDLPFFGNLVKEWETHKVIRPKAKWMSTLMLVVLYSWSIYRVGIETNRQLLILSAAGSIIISVLVFIWTRRSSPLEGKSGVQ